LGLGLVLGSGF